MLTNPHPLKDKTFLSGLLVVFVSLFFFFLPGFSNVEENETFGFFLINFFFTFGYLFYASLFAAVGSAVNEDPQDAQAMMFPITIPIIFSIIVMTRAIGNPTGSLAVWCSIIPFTSPIIMMARLPFGFPGTVAWWELGLSVICMIGGFIFTTWLSAKIYRTGILMYGKKASWKDMLQWVFRKS